MKHKACAIIACCAASGSLLMNCEISFDPVGWMQGRDNHYYSKGQMGGGSNNRNKTPIGMGSSSPAPKKQKVVGGMSLVGGGMGKDVGGIEKEESIVSEFEEEENDGLDLNSAVDNQEYSQME